MTSQHLTVLLLGCFEVRAGDQVVIDRNWSRRNAQALLKILALHERHAVQRDQVLEYLWPETPPEAANNRLRQTLHELRSRLTECSLASNLVTLSSGVLSLNPDAEVDVDAFRALASRAVDSGQPEQAEQALAAYGGDLLPDDLYEEWAAASREELSELRNRLLLSLGQTYAASGEPDMAILRLQELLRLDPVCEQAHQHLIRIYAQTARREQALRQYQRLRDSLRKELAVEPSPESHDLYQAILDGTLTDSGRAQSTSPDGLVVPFPSALRFRDRGAFVGREEEFARLQAMWDLSRSGQRRLAFIGGAAGVGKTRLAAEFAGRLHREGVPILFGRCDEEPADPYQPITHALRTYVGAPRTDAAVVTALRGHPALSWLLPHADKEVAPLSGARVIDDGPNERLRLFDDVASFLLEIAVRPTLLVLDDLQWIGQPALLLLRHTVQATSDAPLFIIGSLRDDEVGRAHPLAALVADLRRDRVLETIELKGLDQSSVATFLASRGAPDPPPTFVEAISQRTQGNPFFMEEILSLLIESQVVDPGADRWATNEWTIPPGVKDVVGRRLMRLSPNCDRLLQIAAVAGPEFPLDAVQAVSGMADEPLLDALDEALQAGLITELPEAEVRYGFAHDLIRSVLYGDLSSGRRARLHQMVGEALETLRSARLEDCYGDLAYHYSSAHTDPDRAIRYSKLAGDQALTVLAYEEAVKDYQLTLRLMEERGGSDPGTKCETLLSMGDAQMRAGDVVAGRATLDEAANIARTLASGALLARAALARAGTWVGAGFGDPSLIAMLEEATRGAPPGPLRIRLLSRLAVELYYGDTPERCMELTSEAVDDARALGDPRELANALNARYWGVWSPGSVDERLAIATEMLALAEAAGDQELVLQGHHFRAFGFLEVGDIQSMREEVAAYDRLAQQLRQPIYLYRSAARRGMLALLEGRFADVEQAVAQEAAISQNVGDDNAPIEIAVQTLVLRRERGGLIELIPMAEAFLADYPAVPGWGAALALASAEQGSHDDARERFDRFAGTKFENIPRDASWLAAHCILAEVCVILGDLDHASDLYQDLLPHKGYNAVIGAGSAFFGAIDHYLGVLAAALARWDDAALHFEEALSMHTRIGARPWIARTQNAYGRMLTARGLKRDAGHAGELLRDAAAAARTLGMMEFPAAAAPAKAAGKPRAARTQSGRSG